jgi:hypothetical protein
MYIYLRKSPLMLIIPNKFVVISSGVFVQNKSYDRELNGKEVRALTTLGSMLSCQKSLTHEL